MAHAVQIDRSFGVCGERAAAVGGDDDGVLDAHAADAGKIDAGLDGDDVAGERGYQSAVAATRGCLVDLEADAVAGPCENASPQPASAITSRHAASTVAARRRRRATASTPGLLARAHDVEHALLRRGPGSPTATVRVMSEQ